VDSRGHHALPDNPVNLEPVNKLLAAVSIAIPLLCRASDSSSPCPYEEVEAHVLREFAIYGPQSDRREYFGFVYQREGLIDSAVARSSECRNPELCVVNVGAAATRIPGGATVLGEWHTHPHDGARSLSEPDVRGAYNNRHIRCYRAYYSNPFGEIYAWSPQGTSVPTAMNSRVYLGNYLARQARAG
jgi:hypothetical protein